MSYRNPIRFLAGNGGKSRANRRAAYCPARVMAILIAIWMLLQVNGLASENPLYIENEWNYVDGSMDVSDGIPENAAGRLAKIRSAGKLTVATSPYYPPQEFIDETKTGMDRFAGADMELARLIAQRMGVTLEIVPMEFTDVLSSVADGKYDLAVSALSFTSGRAAVLEMSKGYYFSGEQASSGLLIREEDADTIRSADDLANKDIVAQSGSLQETMAADNIAFYRKFRRLPSAGDVYDAVREGKADAGVVDIAIARVYIESHPGCGLMIVPDMAFALQPQYLGDRIAGRKGEIQLMYFVNGVIDEVLASGQYEAWFEYYAHQNTALN
ncbi:MAG: transporter substrate-binding domain-containing protein [Clostridia bacterium]|nr:transporter substrate-binding domain-containing protein [Clostridia bacterium]